MFGNGVWYIPLTTYYIALGMWLMKSSALQVLLVNELLATEYKLWIWLINPDSGVSKSNNQVKRKFPFSVDSKHKFQ